MNVKIAKSLPYLMFLAMILLSTGQIVIATTAANAYVIYGAGKSACPINTLCLYKHHQFNTNPPPGFDSAILVVPPTAEVDRAASYGFINYTYDGISSVYNRLSTDAVAFDQPNQKGGVLRIPAGVAWGTMNGMPRLNERGGRGSWNDVIQSVLGRPAPDKFALEARYTIGAHWTDWATGGTEVGYNIVLNASLGVDVRRWSISLNLDHAGKLDDSFKSYFWGKVVQDGSAQRNRDGTVTMGNVIIKSPPDGHVVFAGKDLPVYIRAIYPKSYTGDFKLGFLSALQEK